MNVWPVVFALFQTVLPQAIPQDSAEALRDDARSAERRYESLLRRLAPVRMGGAGGRCDEIVGRFCLVYDGGDPPPERPTPPPVLRARQDVVEALRRAFAAMPGDLETAGPLLRYLIEDDRAEEALSAARTFAWASPDSVWGALLLGYAYHAAGDDAAAERSFDEALARMSAEDRRRFEDIEVFLSGDERGAYDDLEAGARTAYEADFWRLADPLYLRAGNARRAEHFARHVWSRLLSETPRVAGMSAWGRDLEELTLRYGVPTSRERVVSLHTLGPDGYVEHYHPDQLAYLPESLRTEGFPAAPPPGGPWPLERERARSGYAPRHLRRLVRVPHQVARFPSGDSVAVRIYGRMPLDSAAAGAPETRAGLFLLDARYAPARTALGHATVRNDTAVASMEARVVPGSYVYSLELLEERSRLAGRSRYALDVPGYPRTGVALSDPVLAEPFGAGRLPAGRDDARLHPLARLVLEPGDTVGLYAEAHGLRAGSDGVTHYAVELALLRADDPALLVRAVRWLGQALGLAGEDPPPRLSWEGRGQGGRAAILAVDVPLTELDAGLYELELTVTDRVGGSRFTSRRLFRVGGGSD
ncbi:MAG TPA: hypothetical protein VF212_08140 [Longimicrobiales bacterium]